MSEPLALLSILGALLIGAMSPGPSFVLVTRIAVTRSRFDGLAAGLGMGVGGAVFGALALAGLSALLLRVEVLHLAFQLAGGAYLIFLAVRIWRGAGQPLPAPAAGEAAAHSPLRTFWLAFVTQVSNPKTAIVYGGIFAALLPPSPPTWLLVAIPPAVFVVEAGWYAAVALVFSAERPRAGYARAKGVIDRLMGAILGALGARLIFEAAAPRAA